MTRLACSRSLFGLISLCVMFAANARADVKLPSVIGSHMVLQRDRPLPIWGWAEPGEVVTVTLDGKSAEPRKADEKGRWRVTFTAIKADGKTHSLTIAGKNEIVLKDILIGEVWVGSGQSNMEWSVAGSSDPAATIAAANQPQIRLFQV